MAGKDRVAEALKQLRRGRMLVVTDDASREDEGDLILAAEKATPAAVNFMAKHGRGLICAPLSGGRLDQLGLQGMVHAPTESFGTAFSVSVDAKVGVSTGISAHDRARTLRLLADPQAGAADFVRPGHIFPLRARPGGVLERPGHTEAAVDLCRLAGLKPAGVICEIMLADGRMARGRSLQAFARRHGLLQLSIAELAAYRRRHEPLVRKQLAVPIPTRWGDFSLHLYAGILDGKEHLALVKGRVQGRRDVLVRLHSECLTGDLLGSRRCDCGEQLDEALRRIARAGSGILLYQRDEGRGIGLTAKLRAYALQDQGLDTVDANLRLGFPADARDYGVAAQILKDLGPASLRLLSNNPAKAAGLRGHGLTVAAVLPLEAAPNAHNERYLRTKRDRMGHRLSGLGGRGRSAGAWQELLEIAD